MPKRRIRAGSRKDSSSSSYERLEDRQLLAADIQFPNLGFGLNQLVAEHAQFLENNEPAPEYSNADQFYLEDDRVFVEIRAQAQFDFVHKSLEGLGFTEYTVSEEHGLIEGFLPVDKLDDVATLTETIAINPVVRFEQSNAAGSVANEAEQGQNSDLLAMLSNLDGTGITIGVISDSANQVGGGLADSRGTGDLPAAPQSSILIPSPFGGTVDEGRAMMELIHDIAPGATLVFASGLGGDASMANAINSLVGAGADIIVDDLAGVGSQSYFQDSLAAQAIDNAVGAGVTYFSSNGNNANWGYNSATRFEATTVAGIAGNWHDFSGSNDYSQSVSFNGGRFFFQYDQAWGAVASNVDFYILNAAGNAVVASSTLNNVATGTTQELISPAPAPGTYRLAVRLTSGPAPSRFHWTGWRTNATINEHLNTPGAIVTGTDQAHNGATNTIAVGAASYTSPTVPEPFTSSGPVIRTLDAAGNPMTMQVRAKPTITGIDGVNNSFFGSDSDGDTNPNFFGTSASAPNVAALAALLLQQNPSLTPAQVRAGLIGGATDMLTPGYDLTTGFGLVHGLNSSLALTNGVLSVPGDRTGATIDDVFAVARNPLDPTQFDVRLNGTLLGTVESGRVTKLVLNGQTGNDQFVFTDDVAAILPAIELNGGTGIDTLTVNDGDANIFSITGTNAGSVDAKIEFSNMENLVGGNAGNTFNFTGDGSVLSVTGGSSSDVLNFAGSNFTNNAFVLTSSGANGFNGSGNHTRMAMVQFAGIDRIVANATSINDSITGLNATSTWNINNGLTYVANGSTLALVNFDILNGGNAGDTFIVRATNQNWSLNGGGGVDSFGLSSNAASIVGNLDGILGAINIDGGSGANVIGISDRTGSPNNVNVLNNSISGMTTFPLTYRATGGSTTLRLFDSNLGPDSFTVTSLFAKDTLTVFASNGAETFNVGPSARGPMTLQGGIGNDTYNVQMRGVARNVTIVETATGGTGDRVNLMGTNGADTFSLSPASAVLGRETVVWQPNVEFTAVNGTGGNDVFRLAAGTIGTAITGGPGIDRVVGSNTALTWNLTSLNAGNVVQPGVTFASVETIQPGTAADTINLGNTSNGMTIVDSGGIDTINGPSLARTWALTGANAGNINVNNVAWTGIENLGGGGAFDTFVFNPGASLRSISGGGMMDHMNYAAFGAAVSTTLTAIGGSMGANGYNGTSTGLSAGFTNVGRMTGSGLTTDQLTGLNAASHWMVAEASSSYVNGRSRFRFTGYEALQGGTARDYFNVTPFTAATLAINGGVPVANPGDGLRLNFAGVVRPIWTFTSPGVGAFSFNNRTNVNYAAIENLDVFEYGDASASFGTLTANNGARHRLPALTAPIFLGATMDPEGDGQPGTTAMTDDATGIDDEDGVVLPSVLIPHLRAATLVTASAAAKLDAWIDFDGNGVFSASEQIATNLSVSAGQNRLQFKVPANAVTGQNVTARFRLSSQGNLAPTGTAANGEVEDYQVNVSAPAAGTIGVFADPLFPGETGRNILMMAGTNGNDTMVFDTTNSGFKVKINGNRLPIPSGDFQRIGAYGLTGSDSIILGSNVTQAAELYGNQGDDQIFGGMGEDYLRGNDGDDKVAGNGGNDLIFGDAGHDSLHGNQGRDVLTGNSGNDSLFGGEDLDVLLGGSGADWLYGQQSGDLLVGNISMVDNSETGMLAIRDEWNSPRAYRQRMNNIVNGTGSLAGSGFRLLTGVTVFDDGARDRYFGGIGQDGFISLLGSDTIEGLESNELVR